MSNIKLIQLNQLFKHVFANKDIKKIHGNNNVSVTQDMKRNYIIL
jgi:hypothetical protein